MANVSNRSRVQAGVPTGGEFAREQKGENDDLVATPPMATGERNAAITDLVFDRVKAGEMTEVKALNGGRRFQTPELFVGRAKNGDRLYAQVSMEWSDKDRRTTDLEPINGCWNFSVVGTYVEKGRMRRDAGGGQIDRMFIAEGGEMAEFGELWAKNHLNTFTAGTETQMAQADQIKTECMKTSEWGGEPYLEVKKYQDRCFAEIEPDNGYRWGSAWLARELDPAEVDRSLTLLADLNRRAGKER